MRIRSFILKRSSHESKGLACLRFEGYGGGPYPRDIILALKRNWHFFWFSSWNYRLQEIPYHDLIDLFVTREDLASEIQASGRTNCIVVPGGGESFERHDLLFYPTPQLLDIDLLYIARFIHPKRGDIALQCLRYLADRIPNCRAVFLESLASDPATSKSIRQGRLRLGLENNLEIKSVRLQEVNLFLNRSRMSLFTSDDEGLCRAFLQSLLAERPMLCYRNTKSSTRLFYDNRYCHYYEHQTGKCAGEAAYRLYQQNVLKNPGARDYILKEKGFKFYDLAGWQSHILAASVPLYENDKQRLNPNDIVPADRLTLSWFWRTFELVGYQKREGSP